MVAAPWQSTLSSTNTARARRRHHHALRARGVKSGSLGALIMRQLLPGLDCWIRIASQVELCCQKFSLWTRGPVVDRLGR